MARNSSTACPECGAQKTKVVANFRVNDSLDIVRRRKCSNCDYRWYTFQPPEQVLNKYQITFQRPFGIKEVRL